MKSDKDEYVLYAIENGGEIAMNKRRYIYDYIRVMACICIIGIHCTAGYPYNVTNITEIINYCVHAVFRIGLPIFTILSGALILSSNKTESLIIFYYKRFVKIVIPFFIISLFYAIWVKGDYRLSYLFAWCNWISIIKEIPQAALATLETYQSVHLWYVYYILGIYLVAPFFKIMIQNMSEKNQKELIGLILVMEIIYVCFSIFNIEFGIQYFVFSNGIVLFMLGYILVQPWIQRYSVIIEIFGLVAYILSMIMYIYYPNPDYITSGAYGESIFMVMQACALFMFFFNRQDFFCKNEVINQIISLLSKHTFSIYLVHEFVRSRVNNWNIWNNLASLELLRAFCVILVTFIISFVAAFILDNTIFKVIQDFMMKAIVSDNGIGNKKNKEHYQWKNIWLKRICGIGGCILCIFLICLVCKAELPYDEETIEAESSDPVDFVHMESDMKVSQRFQISVQRAISLRSISTIFINVGDEDKDGVLSLRILDKKGKVKYAGEYQISDFVIGDYQEIVFDKPVKIKPNQEYTLELEVKGTNAVPYMLMQNSLNQNRYNNVLSINDEDAEGTLLINYRYYGILPNSQKVIIIMAILGIMLYCAYHLGYIGRKRKCF